MRKDMFQLTSISNPSYTVSCSIFSHQYPQNLLDALFRQNLNKFNDLLLEYDDLNHCYENKNKKTCLDIACPKPGYSEFVKLLLRQKIVDVNKINEVHQMAPIHFAAVAGDPETMRALLEDPNIEVNAMSKGNTALHLAIKHIKDVDKDGKRIISQFEEIIKLLLKSNSDVNIPDLKCLTPIYTAAMQGLEKIVELIIKYSKNPVDLDSYKDRKQNSARTIIEQSFPNLQERLPSKHKYDKTAEQLFSHLSNHNEKQFIADFNKIKRNKDLPKILLDNNGLSTLLQFACANGMDEVAQILLENGADPNLTAPGGSMRPVALACSNGYHKVLKLLAANESTSFEPVNRDSLLQIVIKEAKHTTKGEPKRDYKKCLHILLKNPNANTNVNHLDSKANTALHYATRGGDQEAVMALLKKGACIDLRNMLNESPLADMSAKTLESYLDECLTANSERPNDEDYEIQFNYSFLVPPSNIPDNEIKIPLMDESDVPNSSNDCFLAETDSLLYMTQCSELKPLLKHPVITSFLYLKWQRISWIFHANFVFYMVFCILFLLYIQLGYRQPAEKSKFISTIAYITILGWLLLFIREALQIVMSPKVYFMSIENWLEMCLIVITATILFRNTTSEHSKQQLSAIAILLASAEFIILIGQFPYLTTNIIMLKKVSWNFLKFSLWYGILIIVFALSFYTLFRRVEKDDSTDESVSFDPNKAVGADFENLNNFQNFGTSIFKIFIMLTGEFEAGSINFEAFPFTSHIIFAIFVFMMPIVLFNLLNGLAVSDTQTIKANAELMGHVSRIKLISYFESVILGDASLYKKIVSRVQDVCFWLPDDSCVRLNRFCIKPLARRICLFPNFLPMAQIGVKVNKKSRIVVYKSDHFRIKRETDDDNQSMALLQSSDNLRVVQCNEIKMNRKIVNAAKMLIAKRKEGGNEMKQIKDKLNTCERKIENIENLLTKIYNK